MTFLLRFWKPLAGVAILLLAWWQIHAYGERKADQREVEIRALWEADTTKRDLAAAQAIAQAEAARQEAVERNTEIENDYQAKLAAVERDRDQYVGLLQRARNQVRSISSREATSVTIAVAASEARSAERIGRSIERVESATERIVPECRANNDQLDALVAEIRPQL